MFQNIIKNIFVSIYFIIDILPAVCGVMHCGQKSFKVVWRCQQILSGFLAKAYLSLVSRQPRLSANGKGYNEMIHGAVHRSYAGSFCYVIVQRHYVNWTEKWGFTIFSLGNWTYSGSFYYLVVQEHYINWTQMWVRINLPFFIFHRFTDRNTKSSFLQIPTQWSHRRSNDPIYKLLPTSVIWTPRSTAQAKQQTKIQNFKN